MATQQNERVLVVGAGIAGSVLAYHLARANFNVTVIERSRREQKLGQGLEIQEPALKIVKAMGIFNALDANKTSETGFILENEKSQARGKFGLDGPSPTGDLEMMRGDMCEIMCKAADASPNVSYRFETTIQSIAQTPSDVTVSLKNRATNATTSETFDFVIGADGSNSRTRDFTMGSPEALDCFKPVGAYVAYFSIPKEARDGPLSRACQFPDRKILWIRPTNDDSDVSSVYIMHIRSGIPYMDEAIASHDRTKQKLAFAKNLEGLGWEAPRCTEAMMKTDNFYADNLQQVKLPTWSKDRVVLCGDSAWAPTPFTGQGNQLAIIGAYVLAQEMSRNRSTVAFGMYEKRLRAYVENAQSIPLNGYAPKLMCPETAWGIKFFQMFFATLAWIVPKLMWTGPLLEKVWPESWKGWEALFDLEMTEAEEETARQATLGKKKL